MSDTPLTASDPDFGVPGATKFVPDVSEQKFTPDVSEVPIPQDTRDVPLEVTARAQGYSWRDIDDHVAQATDAAMQYGYSQGDVDQHLGYQDPSNFKDRARNSWTATMAADPKILDGLAAPQPELDLTASPTLTSDYARAVMDREVKGPLDFADHYAAAALSAAHDVLGLDASNLDDVRARQSAGAAAADAIAPSLPSTRDLTDAALAVTPRPTEGEGSEGSFFTPEEILAKHSAYAKGGPYITKLSAPEEADFRQWAQAHDLRVDPPDMATSDYDMRGYWKAVQAGEAPPPSIDPNDNQFHEPDTFKTPYDLTFSRESKYATAAAPEWNDKDQLVLPNGQIVFDDRNRSPYLGQPLAVGGAFDQTRQNLLDHWQDTGQQPLDAAVKASTDPSLADKLTTQPEFFDPAAAELQYTNDVAQDAANALFRYFKWRYDNIGKELAETFGDHIEPIQRDENGRLILPPNIPPQAFNIALAFATGPIHEVGPRIFGNLPEPKVSVVDPSKPPGEAIVEQPAAQVLATPRPAERQPAPEPTEGAAPEGPQPFAETAQPVEKIQALAQEAEGRPVKSFAELAANEDPATQELAKGYDAASSTWHYVRNLVGDLLADTYGGSRGGPRAAAESEAAERQAAIDRMDEKTRAAFDALNDEAERISNTPERLTDREWQRLDAITEQRVQMLRDNGWQPDAPRSLLLRTPVERQEAATNLGNKNYARDLIRKHQAIGEQQIAQFAARLEPLYRLINPLMAEWEHELDKPPGMGLPMRTAIGNALSYIEGRSQGAVIEQNSPLAPFADSVREINQTVRGLLENATAAGKLTMKGYIDDYFAHVWEDPNAAAAAFGTGRQGSSRGLMERTVPTIEDGLNMGLKIRKDLRNPLDLVLHDVTSKIRLLKALDIIDEAHKAGYIHYGTKQKPDDVELMGRGGKKVFPYTNKEGEPAAGVMIAYAPRGFGRVMNNWLSLGWHGTPAGSAIYDRLMFAKNTMTGLQLSFPAYHAWTISSEVLVSGIGNALEELAHGEFSRAALHALEGAAIPVRITRQYFAGRKVMLDYIKGTGDPALRYLVEAGGRFGPRQHVYRMGSAPSIVQSLSRGGMRQLGRELWADVAKIAGPGGEPILKNILMTIPRIGGFAAHEFGRVMTTVSAPLFDHAVPTLQAASKMEAMQTFLRQNPLASEAEKLRRARQIVDNTEDRMGELNLDNTFGPRWVRHLANSTMISQGWFYGTLRMTLAAFGYGIGRGWEWNPVATSRLMAFLMVNAGIAALWQYMRGGGLPDLLTLAGAPKTGGISKGGQSARSVLPGQQKEYFDWAGMVMKTIARPVSVLQNVADYLLGKGYSVTQVLRGMLNGEDAIGHKIHDTASLLHFIRNTVAPLFVTNLEHLRPQSGITKPEGFIGLREAPQWLEDTKGFFRAMAGVDQRDTREELQRARREDAGGSPGLSGIAPAGGGGSSSGGASNIYRPAAPQYGNAYEYLRGQQSLGTALRGSRAGPSTLGEALRGQRQRIGRRPRNAYEYLRQ